MAIHTTYADVLRPQEQQKRLAYDALLVLCGSILIALSAQVAINLPFSPVPITGQTFAVLLIGALYGSRRGAATIVAYLVEGASGLPVFAGGAAGAVVLKGTTAGYLFGFVAAAYAVGWLAERGWDRRVLTTILAMILGNIIIYAFGVTWLSTFTHDFLKAIDLGLTPFIVGDLLKIALATGGLPAGWKFLDKPASQDQDRSSRRADS